MVTSASSSILRQQCNNISACRILSAENRLLVRPCAVALYGITRRRDVSVSLPRAVPEGGAGGAGAGGYSVRRGKKTRRTSKSDTGAPSSAATSPIPPPNPVGSTGSSSGGGGGGGVVAAAAAASSMGSVSVAVTEAPSDDEAVGSVDSSDYQGPVAAGSHIVPFARRQPRALVLDCAYRPINVLTWYKAFHFDYFGKGEVLEYYPPPAVCTTGTGEYPLPAVIRVPTYTADMQDLCSRVACTRRNVMVRDGFCCQYCGSRRELTIDHIHPASKGGPDSWENLVTACMRCNQKKGDRALRDLGWKLKRQPKEPTPYEIGIVAGIATSDILRPPPEWEAYIAPYKERLESYRRAAVEAGMLNLLDDC